MTNDQENTVSTPKQPAPGTLEHLHTQALNARTPEDLARFFDDASTITSWLRTLAHIATRDAFYAGAVQELKYPQRLHLHDQLREDSSNLYFRERGETGPSVLAVGGTSKQLEAAVAALSVLEGAAWSTRAAADQITPGITYRPRGDGS